MQSSLGHDFSRGREASKQTPCRKPRSWLPSRASHYWQGTKRSGSSRRRRCRGPRIRGPLSRRLAPLSGDRLFGLALSRRTLSDQLNGHHGGSIPDPTPGLDQTRVPTLAFGEPSGHVVEQLGHHGLAAKKSESAPASRQITLLSKRDHPICEAADLLGLGLGRLDPLVLEQGCDQAPEQRPSMISISP